MAERRGTIQAEDELKAMFLCRTTDHSRRCHGVRPSVMGVALWALACGPSLSDRPTDFVGDGAVEVAIICGKSKVGPTQSESTWLKSAVRANLSAKVDWAGVTLVTRGVKVVRRAAGRVVKTAEGKSQRTVTYWAVSTVPPGSDGVGFGPVEVQYRTGDGTLHSFSYGDCPLVVNGS